MQLELVLEGLEEQSNANQREINVGNATLVVEDKGFGRAQVVRLISTDPQDYLNPDFAPGTEVQL
nr:YlzJ-like family protein [Desulforadius tongensis]